MLNRTMNNNYQKLVSRHTHTQEICNTSPIPPLAAGTIPPSWQEMLTLPTSIPRDPQPELMLPTTSSDHITHDTLLYALSHTYIFLY